MCVVHQHVKNHISQKARLLLSEKRVTLEATGIPDSWSWTWSLRTQLHADRTVVHTSGPRTLSGLEEGARRWRNEWMSSGHACWRAELSILLPPALWSCFPDCFVLQCEAGHPWEVGHLCEARHLCEKGHPCYFSVGIYTESPLLATCLDYWRRRQFSHIL